MLPRDSKAPVSSFAPVGTILIRAPLLSIDEILTWRRSSGEEVKAPTQTDTLAMYSAHPLAQEAVMVGSADLSESAARYMKGTLSSKKKQRGLEDALHRYLVRMTSRATPFGLFAGVAMGRVGQHTSVTVCRPEQHCKRARPDMAWLLTLLKAIVQRPEVFRQLSYFANPLCVSVGDRIYVPFSDTYNLDVPNQPASYRATTLLRRILELTRTGMSYTCLHKTIQSEWPQASDELVSETLRDLHKSGVLIDSLRPPLTGKDAFTFICDGIREIPECEDVSRRLDLLATSITTYNAKELGEGMEDLVALTDSMKSYVPDSRNKTPLQVDMALGLQQNELSQEVAQEAAMAAELLFRLSTNASRFPHLDAYRDAFVERYGTGCEVPVVELLDRRAGLGPPPTYRHPEPARSVELAYPRHRWRNQFLLALATSAIRDQQREILLDDRMLQQLESRPDWSRQLPQSLDLYVTVCAKSQAAINHGQFQLLVGAAIGSQPAGRAFGRFHHILGDDVAGLLQQIAREEEQASPNKLFAELVFIATQARTSNVATCPVTRQFEIVVGATPSVARANVIDINDIVVGVRHGRFYLRSLTRDAEIVVRASHMYNQHLADNVFRFLLEASAEGGLQLQPFDWGTASRLPYRPRVRHGRIILSAAAWTISEEVLATTTPVDGDKWEAKITAWRAAWQVPRFVFLREGDRHHLLDLDSNRDSAYLSRQCKRKMQSGETVEIHEMIPHFDEVWARDVDGKRYVTEFVIPLQRPTPDHTTPTTDTREIATPPRSTMELRERVQLPGSKWLFTKLYCSEDVQDDILVGSIKPLMDILILDECIAQWFFIRYSDPEPHLRLRLYGEERVLLECALPRVSELAQRLIESKAAYRMVIDSYNREVDRYGGPQTIATAESIFSIDSHFVAQVIDLRRRGLNLSNLELSILSVDSIVRHMKPSPVERESFYTEIEGAYGEWKRTEENRLRKEFYRKRRHVQELLTDNLSLRNRVGGPAILELLEERSCQIAPHAEKLRRLGQSGSLTAKYNSIVHSLVHMHLNRLNGVDRRLEYHIVYHLMRTLQSIARAQREGVPLTLE